MLITALVMVHLDAIIFLDKGLFVATAERFWVIACSGGLSWPIFVHLAKLWACLQPPLVPDPLRHGDSADWRRLLPCSVWVGRKDTETSARQIRGGRQARRHSRGYWYCGAIQREDRSVSKGIGRAGSSQKKGRADREGGKGGGARRGYTPEPVYGQKCGSPRLANSSGQGIV